MSAHPQVVRYWPWWLERLANLAPEGSATAQAGRGQRRLDVQHAGAVVGEHARQVVLAETGRAVPWRRIEQHDVVRITHSLPPRGRSPTLPPPVVPARTALLLAPAQPGRGAREGRALAGGCRARRRARAAGRGPVGQRQCPAAP